MATKEAVNGPLAEFEEFREETRENFASRRAEIRDIRQRFDALEEAARNNAGLRKEIDHLVERECATIQQKIAALAQVSATASQPGCKCEIGVANRCEPKFPYPNSLQSIKTGFS